MRALATSLMVLGLALASPAARSQDAPPYPDVAETGHASPETAAFFASFFTARSRHDVAATMRHFSPDLATYTDATLGWGLAGFDPLEEVFATYMPSWGEGLSYPTRIRGAVDVREGRIVRWVDCWDSSGFDDAVYDQLRTPADAFPADFREGAVGRAASPEIVGATATRADQRRRGRGRRALQL